MRVSRIAACVRPKRLVCLAVVALAVCASGVAAEQKAETIVISAEGLADPNADVYQRDKGIMVDDLRRDARRQLVEKAVGTFVDSATLVENFTVINDRIYTHSQGMIKRIIKESDPWLGKDGLMHMLVQGEVYLGEVRHALEDMSKSERLMLIKESGNPKISVAVFVRDAARGNSSGRERSSIAENILKEQFSRFGYRVWSEDQSEALAVNTAPNPEASNQKNLMASGQGRRASDFTVLGEAKFKELAVTLKASGIKLKKYALTSWTVKCVDNHTAEEIYFNNKVPRGKSWSDEDAALQDIGRMIAGEFNKDFFQIHLLRPSRIFQLQVYGLPDYDTGILFKRELIGLRSVLNVDFRDYDAEGFSLYEVDFSGTRGNFLEIVNGTVVKPLNLKFGEEVFKLVSARGDMLKVSFQTDRDVASLLEHAESMPPASLAEAAPERVRELIKDDKILQKVAAMNPPAAAAGKPESTGGTIGGFNAVKDF